MAIIEEMEPFRSQRFEDWQTTQWMRGAGKLETLYRLNYMGQRMEGLRKEDLVAIMNAIRNNLQYLR